MATHDGHRNRLRQRFVQEGLDHFNEINVLELLLFYCIPRKDTNEIAHRLLERFGGLENVLDATPAELSKVEGIGESAAVFLTMINAVCRMYLSKKADVSGPLLTPDDYFAVLRPKFLGRRNEMVYILCLDAKNKLICCRMVSEGSLHTASVSARKIAEIAISVNATSVVMAHNHVSGLAIPSHEDVIATESIAQALRAMDIILLDHVIVAEDDSISLRHEGKYICRGV